MSAFERPLRIAVIGGGKASDEERAAARALGTALARAGAIVICGGHGGVMEAAAEGARAAGGLTVGVLPGTDAKEANRWIALPIPTGMAETRNSLVVRAAEAVVAVGGEWGTLSEIALARKMGIEVITLGTPPAEGLGLPSADDAKEAAKWALEKAEQGRNSKR